MLGNLVMSTPFYSQGRHNYDAYEYTTLSPTPLRYHVVHTNDTVDRGETNFEIKPNQYQPEPPRLFKLFNINAFQAHKRPVNHKVESNTDIQSPENNSESQV